MRRRRRRRGRSVDRGAGGPAREPRNPEFRAPTLCAKGEGHIARRAFASGVRARRGRGNPCTPANSPHENRETSATPVAKHRPAGEGASRTPRVHVAEESEREIVPMKDSNKDERLSAESLEGSDRAEENAPPPRTVRGQQRAAVSQRLEGVRQAARRQSDGEVHFSVASTSRRSFSAAASSP